MKHPETIVTGCIGGFANFSLDAYDSRSSLSRSSPPYLAMPPSSGSSISMASPSSHQSPKRKRSSARNAARNFDPGNPTQSPSPRASSIQITPRDAKLDEEDIDDEDKDVDDEDKDVEEDDDEDSVSMVSSSSSIPVDRPTFANKHSELHAPGIGLTKSSSAILETSSPSPSPLPLQSPQLHHIAHQHETFALSGRSELTNPSNTAPKREKRSATRLDVLSASTAALSRRTNYSPSLASLSTAVQGNGSNTPRNRTAAPASISSTSRASNSPSPPQPSPSFGQSDHSAAKRRARFARGGTAEAKERVTSPPPSWTSYAVPISSQESSSILGNRELSVVSEIEGVRMEVDAANDAALLPLLPGEDDPSGSKLSSEMVSHAGYYHYPVNAGHGNVYTQLPSRPPVPTFSSFSESHGEHLFGHFLPPLRLPAAGVTRDMQRSLSASSSGSNSGSTSPFHSPRNPVTTMPFAESYSSGFAVGGMLGAADGRGSFSAPSFDTSSDNLLFFGRVDDASDHVNAILPYGSDRRDSLGLTGDAFLSSAQQPPLSHHHGHHLESSPSWPTHHYDVHQQQYMSHHQSPNQSDRTLVAVTSVPITSSSSSVLASSSNATTGSLPVNKHNAHDNVTQRGGMLPRPNSHQFHLPFAQRANHHHHHHHGKCITSSSSSGGGANSSSSSASATLSSPPPPPHLLQSVPSHASFSPHPSSMDSSSTSQGTIHQLSDQRAWW